MSKRSSNTLLDDISCELKFEDIVDVSFGIVKEVTQDQLRATELANKSQAEGKVDRDPIFYFGKYKGQKFSQADAGYLRWICDNFTGKGSSKIIKQARQELRRRNK